MELTFKTKNDKQLLAIESWIDDSIEQILFGGGKGGSKSYTGCSLIFADALIYPETHYFIARKNLNDLRKYTIPSIHEVFKNWGIDINKYAPFNGQDNIFNLYNGSKVYLISCNDEPSDPLYERFGSMQMTRGWIEEAGEVPESAKANLWLAVGRWKNDVYKLKKKLFITANPKKGWMKREFIDPSKSNTLPPEKKFIQALAIHNPYLPQDYVKTLEQEKDPIRRQRLYLGDWDYDEDKDSLIKSESLFDVFSNTIDKSSERFMTADVARFGKDTTVIAIWEGLELYKIHKYTNQGTNITRQTIRDIASQERIPFSHIIIDEDGIGGGVLDGLFGANGFVANSSPIPTQYQIRGKLNKTENHLVPKTNFANLKSQCGYKLAEVINEHKISITDERYRDIIIEEITALLRVKDVDSDGKLTLKPKDEVKEELGKSPDIGDAIIFRMWFELRNESLLQDPNSQLVRDEQKNNFLRNRNNAKIRSNK